MNPKPSPALLSVPEGSESASNEGLPTQWAWPFEEASEDDRSAHMSAAHHILFGGVDFHREMHEVGQPVVPHVHMTPEQAAKARAT